MYYSVVILYHYTRLLCRSYAAPMYWSNGQHKTFLEVAII